MVEPASLGQVRRERSGHDLAHAGYAPEDLVVGFADRAVLETGTHVVIGCRCSSFR